MRNNGIMAEKGILEYPKHHKKEEVFLSADDEKVLQSLPAEMETLLKGPCPPAVKKRFCQKCAFCEFCYTDPSEEF
jgi:CRISPR-associated exonuclease Cas4